MKATLVVSAVALLPLGGCGRDAGTRAITGGAIGVAGAAVLGAPLLAGAAVGAVAGAATTDHRDHNHDERRNRRDRD